MEFFQRYIENNIIVLLEYFIRIKIQLILNK